MQFIFKQDNGLHSNLFEVDTKQPLDGAIICNFRSPKVACKMVWIHSVMAHLMLYSVSNKNNVQQIGYSIKSMYFF